MIFKKWWDWFNDSGHSLCCMSHSSFKLTISPSQLALGWDIIFCQKVMIDWYQLKQLCQKVAMKNNIKEDKKHLNPTCQIGVFLLLLLPKHKKHTKKKHQSWMEGPYPITKVVTCGHSLQVSRNLLSCEHSYRICCTGLGIMTCSFWYRHLNLFWLQSCLGTYFFCVLFSCSSNTFPWNFIGLVER